MKHPSKPDWNNLSNAEYYDEFPIDTLQGYAEKGGLASGIDVELIFPRIAHTTSLLEIGACYGRIVDHLLRLGYKGHIDALERGRKFSALLAEKYSEMNISVINQDLAKLTTKTKYDAILWMWSGISDFAENEQQPIVNKLYGLLKPNGIAIIETFSHTQSPVNAKTDLCQHYTITGKNSSVHGFIPTPEAMKLFATNAGFSNIQYLPYKTTENRPRNIYLLTKEP
ncbi:MAG: class I SAM-dependent methyltransferase [Gammaproteobacteria bacterium]|nr:class I SAM-dependent methyltransferase [Gammaproteobacteria bacterium]